MKIELFFISVTAFFVANTYYNNAIVSYLTEYKKYGVMAFYIFVGVSAYLIIKRNPLKSKTLIGQASTYVKYMPIDKTTERVLTPILDFVGTPSTKTSYPIYDKTHGHIYGKQEPDGNQGGSKPTTKRSVSETKKKWVASNQNWTCVRCQQKLPAWFEVDHKVRLEYGGTNDVSNLEALCRDCHGRKTAFENL